MRGEGGAGERADLATPRIQVFGPPAPSFRDTTVQATAPPSTDIGPVPNPLLFQTHKSKSQHLPLTAKGCGRQATPL